MKSLYFVFILLSFLNHSIVRAAPSDLKVKDSFSVLLGHQIKSGPILSELQSNKRATYFLQWLGETKSDVRVLTSDEYKHLIGEFNLIESRKFLANQNLKIHCARELVVQKEKNKKKSFSTYCLDDMKKVESQMVEQWLEKVRRVYKGQSALE